MVAVAAAPAVAGWLVQFTPPSVQVAVFRSASSVRPLTGDLLYMRRVAPVRVQPEGTLGSVNATTARMSFAGLFDVTLSTLSLPRLRARRGLIEPGVAAGGDGLVAGLGAAAAGVLERDVVVGGAVGVDRAVRAQLESVGL